MNKDERFNRYTKDPRFHRLVKVIEDWFYSDNRITYEEVLDAAYVARVRYVELNPTVVLASYGQKESGE